MKTEKPTKGLNDKARSTRFRGKHALVPLKFDEDGEIATPDHIIIKRLSLQDLRFLREWRASKWNLDLAISKTNVSRETAVRLVKRLSCFRIEDDRVKALAEIPTPSWITAKHVENVYSGGSLEESEHKSLAELAKIEGAYKQQAQTTQVNVFNISLTPDQEAKLKPVFDAIALETPDVAA